MISAMASKFCITLLLLAVPNFGTGAPTNDVYGQTGGDITLIPTVGGGDLQEVLWRHNHNKAVEFDQNITEFGQFKGRTSLDPKTGQLTITQLKRTDNGQYKVELVIKGTVHEYNYAVTIIDAVTKPTVTCQNINSSTVTLRCAGDQSPLTKYSWVGPEIQNKSGSELQLNNEDVQSSDAAIYTCVVKNPVSEKRSDFYVKTCSASQVNIAEIAGGVIGVILLLVIIAGVYFCCWRKRNQEGNVGREEKMADKTFKGSTPEGADGDFPQAGHVKKTVQQFGGPGKRIMIPNKPIDEDKDETEPLIEAQKTADGGAGLPLEERQAEGADGDDQQPGHVKKTVQQFGGPGKRIMIPNKPIDEDKDETEPLIEAQKTADGGAGLPLEERQAGSSIGTCNEDKNKTEPQTEPPKTPEGADGDDQQPGHVKKTVQQFGGPGKRIMIPNKPIDEDKDETEPLIEAQKTADGGARLPLEERQAESFSNESGGFSPKSPASGSVPLSLPCSSPACTPETGKGGDVESEENGGSEDNLIPDLKNQSPPSVQSEAVEREIKDLAPPLLVSSTEHAEIQDPNLHTTTGSPADTKEDEQKCSTSPAMPDGDQMNSEIQDTGAEHSEERQEEEETNKLTHHDTKPPKPAMAHRIPPKVPQKPNPKLFPPAHHTSEAEEVLTETVLSTTIVSANDDTRNQQTPGDQKNSETLRDRERRNEEPAAKQDIPNIKEEESVEGSKKLEPDLMTPPTKPPRTQEGEQKERPSAMTPHDQDPYQTVPPTHQSKVAEHSEERKEKQKTDELMHCDQKLQKAYVDRGPRPKIPRKPNLNKLIPPAPQKTSEAEEVNTETVSNTTNVSATDETRNQLTPRDQEKTGKPEDQLKTINPTLVSTTDPDTQGDTTEEEMTTDGGDTENVTGTQGNTTENESEIKKI
ncbi:hypothetical protein AGOR_G00217270 [Albula goreensis]|uniref:Ig-like domain-containing protein n=1 Tax=Albula goreensis TaxID=1534307 RepID=A0A8T3CPG0_9TELE|nr:hypothetical protein AGOR_G00217270 [Albula goreensis]